MLELGPLGFFLVYFVRLCLALFAFRQALRLRTRFHRALATASFLFFLAAIPGGVVFDVTADLYYWFFGRPPAAGGAPRPRGARGRAAAARAGAAGEPLPAQPACRRAG